jgi:hypothetical protein
MDNGQSLETQQFYVLYIIVRILQNLGLWEIFQKCTTRHFQTWTLLHGTAESSWIPKRDVKTASWVSKQNGWTICESWGERHIYHSKWPPLHRVPQFDIEPTVRTITFLWAAGDAPGLERPSPMNQPHQTEMETSKTLSYCCNGLCKA